MEPRLTRGEYWLLNNVVEATCPLSFLVCDRPGELFNNPGHRLPRPRLVETLVAMSDQGWIEGYRIEDGFPLTAQMIDVGFGERPTEEGGELGYRLTPHGGAVWEAFAVPDWQRYLHAWTSPAGELNEYYCATRGRLERYLALLHYHDIFVLPETVVWDEVRPWQATYWKELPHGHRVRFRHEEPEELVPRDHDLIPNGVYSLQKWYDWA